MLYGTVYMKQFKTRISEDCLSLGAQSSLKDLILTKNGGHAGSNPDHNCSFLVYDNKIWYFTYHFFLQIVPSK